MKKLFALLLAAMMLLALAACGQTEAEETKDVDDSAPPVVGGWTITEDAALTDEAQAAFDKALDGLTGVGYTPLALLGTQLVSGTNYCILCEAKVVYPDAVPYYALVYVYADLQGNAEILDIVILDIGDIAESGEIRPAAAAPEALLGGWRVDRESSVAADKAILHLASQAVNGVNHCVLCAGPELVFVYEAADGSCEVTSRVPLDPGALID